MRQEREKSKLGGGPFNPDHSLCRYGEPEPDCHPNKNLRHRAPKKGIDTLSLNKKKIVLGGHGPTYEK